jgi:hypothetical protein
MFTGGPSVDVLTLDGGGAILIAAGLQALATLIAVIVAGCIAGGYRRQQKLAQARSRAKVHADAIKAIADYMEAPYRVLRRDGSAAARMHLTNLISDIQAELRYFETLLRLESTDKVAAAYEAATAAARREAGGAITRAWRSRPTKRDRDVPIASPIPTPETTRLIALAREAMAKDVD